MATAEEVEETLHRLMQRFGGLDRSYRSLLPSRRTVEATFPDVGLVYHAYWRDDRLSDLHPGPAPRADIRVSCGSDDLLALANGELRFRRAYATSRLQVEASMTDLLRLRGVLV